ncbi:MAG: flavin reductase family protein [Acidobacteria bacterium]|nr:flavin reductase family protein [Acidobacteriota bacterium]
MPVSKEKVRKVLGHFATGVTVVTTRQRSGVPWGFTVNSFTSVSLTPPLILICVDHGSESSRAMKEAEYFAVNFLAEDQEDISRRFATKSADRFQNLTYAEGVHGSPVLAGSLGFVECRKVASHSHGDHTVIVGEVLEADVHGGAPLLFYGSAYARLEPSLEPTKH